MIFSPSRHPRRAHLLCELHRAHPGSLHVRAHRTARGAALITETGRGVSYPATIWPLVALGLAELGDRIDAPGPYADYHRSVRPLVLTPAGHDLAMALAASEVEYR